MVSYRGVDVQRLLSGPAKGRVEEQAYQYFRPKRRSQNSEKPERSGKKVRGGRFNKTEWGQVVEAAEEGENEDGVLELHGQKIKTVEWF